MIVLWCFGLELLCRGWDGQVETQLCFLCDGRVTPRNHSVRWSVCWSVGPNTKFDTKFQRKIQHKMDTIANAVTQLGVIALVWL